jgi:hypothetical protein
MKVKRKKKKVLIEVRKNQILTKSGFVKRLVAAGWKIKEAIREYNRIREGTDGVEQDCYPD